MKKVSEIWKSGKNGKIGVVAGITILMCGCCSIILGAALSSDSAATKNPPSEADIDSIKTQAVETVVAGIPTAPPAPTTTPAPSLTPKPSPTQNPNIIRSGTYLVNTDILPGLYTGQVSGSCYWARLKDLTGSFDAIIANDNAVGKFYFEVLEGDAALEIHCQAERLEVLPTPPAEFPQKIDAGTYLVNIDIRPGTYKGDSSACYWERESSVTGGFSSIISNGNADGQFYVQVAPTDFALKVGCSLEWVSQ